MPWLGADNPGPDGPLHHPVTPAALAWVPDLLSHSGCGPDHQCTVVSSSPPRAFKKGNKLTSRPPPTASFGSSTGSAAERGAVAWAAGVGSVAGVSGTSLRL